MAASDTKTAQKVAGRIARHSAVRYHNDSKLFSAQTKVCPICNRPFANRKKWQIRGLWPAIVYCSKKCRKLSKLSV